MFCKFCGDTIDASQVKCRRCGRDIPAASDCGGYYDVIKDLNKRGYIDSKSPTQVYVTQKAPESKVWVFTLICAVLLIGVLLLQMLIIKKVDGLRAVVDDYEPCECTVSEVIYTEDDSDSEDPENNAEIFEDLKEDESDISDMVSDEEKMPALIEKD